MKDKFRSIAIAALAVLMAALSFTGCCCIDCKISAFGMSAQQECSGYLFCCLPQILDCCPLGWNR